jgi:spermidine synthase
MGQRRRQPLTGEPGAQVRSGRAELLRDLDRANAYLLIVDGVPQSHVDLDDPTDLEFEYVRWIADIADLAAPAGQPLRALHLGGGAATIARYLAATRPGSKQTAAEVDDLLVDLVRERIGYRVPGLRMRIIDGRELVASRRDASVDLIVVDAFAGARLPLHLATTEFTADAARVLRPDGVHVVNVGDGAGLLFARRVAATLAATYPHVQVLTDPSVLRGRRFGNVVLAAGRRPLPIDELARAAGQLPALASVLSGERLRGWYGRAAPLRDGEETAVPLLPDSLWPD